jgi:hypothetical protein
MESSVVIREQSLQSICFGGLASDGDGRGLGDTLRYL